MDPVSRAACVWLYSEQPTPPLQIAGSSNKVSGHAGLFTDQSGALFVRTVRHVATDLTSLGDNLPTKVTIPNDNLPIVFENDNLNWTNIPSTHTVYPGVDDYTITTQPLTADVMDQDAYNALLMAVNNKAITPLIAASYEELNAGEILVTVMPDTGELATYEFLGHGDNGNYLLLQINSGRVCEGFSGQPLLESTLDTDGNRHPTNRAYGMLVGLGKDTPIATCENPGKNSVKNYVGFSPVK